MTAQETAASLVRELSRTGKVASGLRPGDRVEIRIPGVDLVAFGILLGYEYLRPIGSEVVELDGTGQVVRVPAEYLTKEAS